MRPQVDTATGIFVMITEIELNSFPSVLPLYRATGMCFPLILAVIQKQQRGQLFVDNQENPNSAVVITNFGFMSYIGTEQNETFDAGLGQLLASKGITKASYLLWYSPPPQWQKRLDALVPDLVRRRERTRWEFCEERVNFLREGAECPAGFELRNLDRDLIPKTEKLGVSIDSRFWSSAADFCEHGLGVCLMKNSEVVSVCYCACVADRLAEVDIVTLPDYRGDGLATLVAQQFIKECVSRGWTPTWDCFESNVGSVKLAERLGFIKLRTYPLYSFNVPLKLNSRVI